MNKIRKKVIIVLISFCEQFKHTACHRVIQGYGLWDSGNLITLYNPF